ncbi:MAG: beta-ketoacyl-ACP reductase [Candidatus Rokuibacteriota bacterium]|nr:MAG: beta-ketoacyl-ACP reductase [Candidatus Rokubacteria bacterium]
MPAQIDLTGRVALVTGASRGIGRAIATGLARAGATVCINYRQQHERAKETLQAIEAAGGHAFVHQADVSDRAQADALIGAVVGRAGRLDILVNNAGISREGLFVEMSDGEWTSVLETNLGGVYHCARQGAHHMLRQGWGRIINVSSVLVSRAGRGQVNYAASKGGVNALTTALATELGPRGVTVNAIAPGLIETDMSRPFIGMSASKIREWIPMRRVGRPEEVAALAVFLASEDAGYITGQIIAVDGGIG